MSFLQNAVFLPLRKDILTKIYPIELQFSGFVVRSELGVLRVERFYMVHVLKVMH